MSLGSAAEIRRALIDDDALLERNIRLVNDLSQMRQKRRKSMNYAQERITMRFIQHVM